MVITEALAELKLLSSRIAKKRSTLKEYVVRHSRMVDPFIKEGGSERFIASELQAIGDLENNIINLRSRISEVNATNSISIGNMSRPIADWLVWRREIAPLRQAYYQEIIGVIQRVRAEAAKRGATLVGNVQEAKSDDVLININEPELLKEAEALEEVLQRLDGQLSLKNATVTI